MKVKEESEKAGLKHSKTKIMPSSPNISWQTDRETMETETHFIFLGSKFTATTKLKDEDIKLKDAYSLEEKLWQT